MEKGKISVIIPVYNGEAWLKECVESIREQTCKNFEILILDGNSTDKTEEIARILAAGDGRIRVAKRQKKGVSSARNQGLEETDGEYVTFVDADDKIDSKMFENLLNCLETKQTDIALCDYYRWDGKTSEFSESKENAGPFTDPAGRAKVVDRDAYLAEYLLHGATRCWSVLYRRDAIGAVRFREDLTIGEDMMFLMDLLSNLHRIGILDYKGYYYRINESGAMMRPFTPSYMDEIKSWKLAGEKIAKEYPQLQARASGILAVSAMLAAGKLSRLSKKERRRYQSCVDECHDTVKEALKTPGAKKELPAGYPIKTALFLACPSLYLGLYHVWKS